MEKYVGQSHTYNGMDKHEARAAAASAAFTAPMPRDASEIENEITHIRMELDNLMVAIKCIGDRLVPVMGPEVQVGHASAEAVGGLRVVPASIVGIDLHDAAMRVRSASLRIAELNERLRI